MNRQLFGELRERRWRVGEGQGVSCGCWQIIDIARFSSRHRVGDMLRRIAIMRRDNGAGDGAALVAAAMRFVRRGMGVMRRVLHVLRGVRAREQTHRARGCRDQPGGEGNKTPEALV